MKARNQKIQTQYDHTKKELGSIQKEIKLLRQKLENQNGMLSIYETNGNEDKWKKENTFMESKVVLTFQEYANVGKKPSASEWKDLQKLIEANLPAFWQNMSLFKGILDDEFRICLLTRLSFSPSQIANLLGVSKQSVTNKRKKLALLSKDSKNEVCSKRTSCILQNLHKQPSCTSYSTCSMDYADIPSCQGTILSDEISFPLSCLSLVPSLTYIQRRASISSYLL